MVKASTPKDTLVHLIVMHTVIGTQNNHCGINIKFIAY